MSENIMIDNILEEHIVGYIHLKDNREQYIKVYVDNNAENVASFIAKCPLDGKITLCNELDEIVLTTLGNYLDCCYDKRYRIWLLDELIQMQTGEKETLPIKMHPDTYYGTTEEDFKKFVLEKN